MQSGNEPFTGAGQFKFALVTTTNTSASATAIASIVFLGGVTAINVTFGGSGYVTPPAISLTGGGGSGATATAFISGGVVTSIQVNTSGSGYTLPPTVIIAPPPPTLAYLTHWSNNGTSVNGSEPTAAVTLPVNHGLFTARLGDATVANMTAFNADLFTRPNLLLRLWFNDGINGFEALQPPQPLNAAPYAVQAGGASNLLGTVGPTSLSGTYSSAVTLNNPANSYSGSGAGLTSLNAAQLTSGTVADARLSGNVAWRNQNNAFSVSQAVPAGTTTAPGLTFNGDANTGLFSPAADTVAVTTGGAERFRVTSGGLLGVGTNNPAARLHIASAGSTPQLHLGQNDSVNAFTRMRFSVGNTNLWDLAAGGAANGLNFFNSANGNVMVLAPNGHLRVNSLGVGVDSAMAPLTVAGDSSQPQLRLQQTTGGAAPRLRMINGNSPYWDMLTAANGDYIRWYSEKTGFNAMTLLDDGTLVTAGPVNPPSDRNMKQDFAPVDVVVVLEKVAALPIQSWAYKNSPKTRHIGPVAQDFHAAFRFNGDDDKHISTVDADGVALAAIQGLNQKLEETRAENVELRQTVNELKILVQSLNQQLNANQP